MSAKLSDLLPASSQKNILLSSINRGDVFRLKLTPEEGITPKNESDEDRNKYFVVLGRSESNGLIGFVVINTEVNKNLSHILQDLHYPIYPDRYPFLKKIRFVCCTGLKEITEDKFTERYDGKRYGSLLQEDLDLIIGAVQSSPIQSAKQLKEYGL